MTVTAAEPLPPSPQASGEAGAGLAILVNANAKRGGRRVAVEIARALPGAAVRLTKTPSELEAWLRVLSAPRGVFAAGGDGSVVALVNALARITPDATPLPTIGILPLGTGNAWAHAMGAPKLHRCLELLARCPTKLPTHQADLVDVEGTLTHFAGAGWDAMVIEDYKRQLAAARGPGRRLSKTIYGYVSAALFRTAPKIVATGNPRLVIETLSDEVYGVGADGCPYRLPVRRGAVLYDGPAGTASVGTCPEFGYGFKAFPFAERMPGFVSLRVFARDPVGAVASMPRLWQGLRPVRGMHDWLVTHVRMTFSRPIPLQVGGDSCGLRRIVEYQSARRRVRMVDWWRLK